MPEGADSLAYEQVPYLGIAHGGFSFFILFHWSVMFGPFINRTWLHYDVVISLLATEGPRDWEGVLLGDCQ